MFCCSWRHHLDHSSSHSLWEWCKQREGPRSWPIAFKNGNWNDVVGQYHKQVDTNPASTSAFVLGVPSIWNGNGGFWLAYRVEVYLIMSSVLRQWWFTKRCNTHWRCNISDPWNNWYMFYVTVWPSQIVQSPQIEASLDFAIWLATLNLA
jgi:hypothetical protein